MSATNQVEKAKQKIDSLIRKIKSPEYGAHIIGENFSHLETPTAIQIPDELTQALKERDLTLYLALAPDGKLILSVADNNLENYQLLTAVNKQKGYKTRGNYYETWYLSLYGEGQRGGWDACDQVYETSLKILETLAQHEVVTIPESLLEAQRQIENSDGHINTIEKVEAYLNGIWDLFKANNYPGKIQKLTDLGFTPQNMRGAMSAMNFD